jgi:hypothetical protein
LAIGDFVAARDVLHDDRASRPAILAVVIGAHLAAFFIALPDKRVTDSAYWHTPTSIVPPPPEPSKRRPLPPLTVGRITNAITSPTPPPLAPMDLSSETAAPSGAAMAPPDWKQSGMDAAADAARKDYRALGPRAGDPKIKAPPSPFEPPPRHKFGELDEDALRNPILWLSANCYLRPKDLQAQPGDPFADVPMTFCSFPFGKRHPRGDLFEHLRKQPPVP